LTHSQETVAARDIEGLHLRIAALEGLFAKPPGELEEQRSRNELIRYVIIPLETPGYSLPSRGFKRIEGQLRSLSEKPALNPPTEYAQDDDEVSGLLEDLREAIDDTPRI